MFQINKNYLLDKKVIILQPTQGYRVSIDAVLLSALVPKNFRGKVLDVGAAVLAVGLCVAKRAENTTVHGLELQEELIKLAEENIKLNNLEDRLSIKIHCVPDKMKFSGSWDFVLTNPPFIDISSGCKPKIKTRALAHMESVCSLDDWLNFCISACKVKGYLGIIHRADRLDEILSIVRGKIGDIMILPIYSFSNSKEAKRVIVVGRRGTKGATKILSPLVVHKNHEPFDYTELVEDILKGNVSLDVISI